MTLASLPLPTVRTVYAVYDGDEVVYVGLTTNLGRREMTHRRTSSWCLPRHFFAALSTHRDTGRTAELAAIDKYKPKFNIVGNGGTDWREDGAA